MSDVGIRLGEFLQDFWGWTSSSCCDSTDMGVDGARAKRAQFWDFLWSPDGGRRRQKTGEIIRDITKWLKTHF